MRGNSEFIARNVTIEGNYKFEVPNGHQMELVPLSNGKSSSNRFEIKLRPLDKKLEWQYEIIRDEIEIKRI